MKGLAGLAALGVAGVMLASPPTPTEPVAAAPAPLTRGTVALPRDATERAGGYAYDAPEIGAPVRIRHDGAIRTFRTYGAERGPTVVLLHGSGRRGTSMIDMWRRTAQRHGLVLVAPDSRDPAAWHWDDDGPAFLAAVLEAPALRGRVEGRPMLAGHSGGAIFATRLANRDGARWAGASVHAGFPAAGAITRAADPAPPVQLLIGTDDHLFALADAGATAAALAAAGHPTSLAAVEGHTHWYYDDGPFLAETAWRFLAAASAGDRAPRPEPPGRLASDPDPRPNR